MFCAPQKGGEGKGKVCGYLSSPGGVSGSSHVQILRSVPEWLKDKNIRRNPKNVLKIMKKYGLRFEIRRRRK